MPIIIFKNIYLHKLSFKIKFMQSVYSPHWNWLLNPYFSIKHHWTFYKFIPRFNLKFKLKYHDKKLTQGVKLRHVDIWFDNVTVIKNANKRIKLFNGFESQKGIPWIASIHFDLHACCQTIHSNVELMGAQEITVS